MNDLATHAATMLLLYLILPAWIVAGLADYLCHRATLIEKTSGAPESILHLLQLSLVGIPTVLALLVEINASFFLLAVAAIIFHHIVAFLDLRYAGRKRAIIPIEQMVHSFLEILPITALLLLAVLHWSEFMAVDDQLQAMHFDLRPKNNPLPAWYVITAIGSAIMFNLIPYVEELVRCLRTQNSREFNSERN